ncbi:polysaccharide deacetylase family protein [Bradyrhizobium sp. NP1]|uniref:polysaccharide deacetylase family protein n=1 Tax=Bradyrhizobium sp. NP1 TaxID=3049772 RepID=UPI0025A51995|nr:polysaccharide deacetylase family protein [Bradyrhizobium sp. NP1]WJR77320.1 polysaccharide deacetylase family protein [Bradyrhizobium sp. NP1]
MKPETYITTSWDDGNPADLRIAELLVKHGVRGTFYVPMSADTGTMTAAQIRELSSAFEIGAHTLHHVVLPQTRKARALREIVGSKLWLEDTIGRPCRMFCPPTGAFSELHLEMIRRAGFIGLRTTELGSLDLPRVRGDLVLMPTTVQAYPHGLLAFVRNAAKRMAFANLWRFVIHGRTTDWPELARYLLRRAIDHGGVFHLWGHSWELGTADQWTRLDEVLQAIKEVAASAPSLENGEIAQRFLAEPLCSDLRGTPDGLFQPLQPRFSVMPCERRLPVASEACCVKGSRNDSET